MDGISAHEYMETLPASNFWEWQSLPLKQRDIILLNRVMWQALSHKPHPSYLKASEKPLVVTHYISENYPLSWDLEYVLPYVKWLVGPAFPRLGGKLELQSVNFIKLMEDMAATQPDQLPELTPCRVMHLNKSLGIFLDYLQFLEFATALFCLNVRITGNWGEAMNRLQWMTVPLMSPRGIAVKDESPLEVRHRFLELQKSIKHALSTLTESFQIPIFIGKIVPEESRAALQLFCLSPEFMNLYVKPIQQHVEQAMKTYKEGDVPEDASVDDMLTYLFGPWPEDIPLFMPGAPKEPDTGEPDIRTTTPPATASPSPEQQKSQRLAHRHRLDHLPNVLEGLDAFEVLNQITATGFLEHAFKGEPAVIERLKHEAAIASSTIKRPRSTASPSQSSFGLLEHVTQGNLMFANLQAFRAVQKRRYAGRDMLKLRNEWDTGYDLADIQVLAPHEFGQVPGFVAGQYRPQRDRLCTVMLTFDEALWELSLKERKTLIEDSTGPKLWVFPGQWLANLPPGHDWWEAGWFGTPLDPAIADFTKQANISA